MRELKTLREGWDEIEREELRLAGELTIEESVRIFVSLCEALEPQMRETEELFRRDREAYLTELQARLRRFEEWRKQQDGTSTKPD
ncbi:MAG TPA: hypothetical protein VFV34_24355 [Blastocatellia bacterium]|nr:hypothetical protein [Blastocatellia bacterium]